MPKPSLWLTLLLVATLLSPLPALGQDEPADPEPEGFSSENMSHVKNLPYRIIDHDVEELPYGTDIEFATLDASNGEASRLAGSTRISTAVEISSDTFDRADTVVIATGYVYADALAGAALAADLRAPILLSTVDTLPTETAEEIQRLGARDAILLGGEAALSAAVATAVEELGLTVERIEGANRFATAAAVAERIGAPTGEVLVAEGEHSDPERGWETALSAAAFGAAHDIPLLLVNAERLPEETAAIIAPTDDSGEATASVDVVIIGNETNVTPAVEQAITDLGANVTRIGGTDIYETSALAAEESFRRGALRTRVYAATGNAFADGLVAGAAVGTTGGVLYLVDGQDLTASPQVLDSLDGVTVGQLRIAGGTAAISNTTAAALGNLVADGPADVREYSIAGSEFNGMQIVDISDPENAEVVAVYDCAVTQGDIQIFTKGARTFGTFTSEDTTSLVHTSDCVRAAEAAGAITFVDETRPNPDDPSGQTTIDEPDGLPDSETPAFGTYVIELTNPLIPTYAGFIPVPEGSHNLTVHPSGDYAYNSNSSLIVNPVTSEGEESTYIEYYDISDLDNIERLGTLPLPVRPGLGTESHDITFSADGDRAYSAALAQTVIIDTTDPANPAVLSSFVDPAINVEHQADPIDVTDSAGNERRLLIVEDELAGAAGNGFCPGGGMHVYDITGDNELNPQLHKVGTYFIPEFRPAGSGSGQGEAITCTAHVFRIYPEQGIITIAWYNAGVWVLDISGLADEATNPTSEPIQTLGFFYFDNSDTWSFKTNVFEDDGSFYGYGNDITRGMDVYRFDASVTATDEGSGVPLSQGRWVNQATAVTMAQRALIANGYAPGEQASPRCLLVQAE